MKFTSLPNIRKKNRGAVKGDGSDRTEDATVLSADKSAVDCGSNSGVEKRDRRATSDLHGAVSGSGCKTTADRCPYQSRQTLHHGRRRQYVSSDRHEESRQDEDGVKRQQRRGSKFKRCVSSTSTIIAKQQDAVSSSVPRTSSMASSICSSISSTSGGGSGGVPSDGSRPSTRQRKEQSRAAPSSYQAIAPRGDRKVTSLRCPRHPHVELGQWDPRTGLCEILLFSCRSCDEADRACSEAKKQAPEGGSLSLQPRRSSRGRSTRRKWSISRRKSKSQTRRRAGSRSASGSTSAARSHSRSDCREELRQGRAKSRTRECSHTSYSDSPSEARGGEGGIVDKVEKNDRSEGESGESPLPSPFSSSSSLHSSSSSSLHSSSSSCWSLDSLPTDHVQFESSASDLVRLGRKELEQSFVTVDQSEADDLVNSLPFFATAPANVSLARLINEPATEEEARARAMTSNERKPFQPKVDIATRERRAPPQLDDSTLPPDALAAIRDARAENEALRRGMEEAARRASDATARMATFARAHDAAVRDYERRLAASRRSSGRASEDLRAALRAAEGENAALRAAAAGAGREEGRGDDGLHESRGSKADEEGARRAPGESREEIERLLYASRGIDGFSESCGRTIPEEFDGHDESSRSLRALRASEEENAASRAAVHEACCDGESGDERSEPELQESCAEKEHSYRSCRVSQEEIDTLRDVLEGFNGFSESSKRMILEEFNGHNESSYSLHDFDGCDDISLPLNIDQIFEPFNGSTHSLSVDLAEWLVKNCEYPLPESGLEPAGVDYDDGPNDAEAKHLWRKNSGFELR